MLAVDGELELIRDVKLKDCPETAANALKLPDAYSVWPYTMSMIGCISFQTNLSANMGMGVLSRDEPTDRRKALRL